MSDLTIEQRIDLAKREVLADVIKGIVPATVGTFSELHDYVDANGYGGLFDLPFDTDEDRDAACDVGNAVQDAVDKWLRESGPLPPCQDVSLAGRRCTVEG